MKILYTTTIGLTSIFFKNYISELINDGNTVDFACDESEYNVDDYYRKLGCKIFQIDWKRTPFSFKNITAYSQLKRVILENDYDLVHCHTPIAGALTRLVCRSQRRKGLKVFYTAHGFHFYSGAPLINWLLYYPMEKYCSRFTDVIFTINSEDYNLAKNRFKAENTVRVNGVGIDIEKFRDTIVDKCKKRNELGIPNDSILLLSVGELNKNKNHSVIIKSLKMLNNSNIHYVIVGDGSLKVYLQELVDKLNLSDNVHLIGYRKDVNEIMKSADFFVHPSLREGLPVSVMEAMASGLMVIGNSIRGLNDLIPSENLVRHNDESEYAKKIEEIISNNEFLRPSQYKIEDFSYKKVNEIMKKMYYN